jgi:hypothetical protein
MLVKGTSYDEFDNLEIIDKFEIRNALYEQTDFIDDFIKENPIGMSEEEKAIVLGFKNFVEGSFFVVKYLKNYAVFLQDGIAFGVLGLGSPVEWLTGGDSPIMIETVLLPFKGQIVIDGIVQGSPISFGPGYRKSINQEYQEAKAKHGIVLQLPFEEQKISPEDQLAFYMKSMKNQEYYAYEIDELLDQYPKLEDRYFWLLGKSNSRSMKKELKALGIQDIHYAMVNDVIVAHPKSAKTLKEEVQSILPATYQKRVFYFKL